MIKTITELENFITTNWNNINEYIDTLGKELELPLYTSVDIRESDKKMAPVDNNLYPAGFNNLCMLDLQAASEALEKFITSIKPEVKSISILIESHTKNKFYLDNISYLKKALIDAGFPDVKFISFDTDLFEGASKISLESFSHFEVEVYLAKKEEDKIYIDEAEQDFVILNNDQSEKMDISFNEVSTPIHPSPKAGWYARSKANHFIYYKEVLEEFCKKFDIDTNLLQAQFEKVDNVNFNEKSGLEKIASAVDKITTQNPGAKVFVKGDQGTYGMGISVVSSGEEIISLNRKSRNKMDIGKNKIKFSSVIVQEGIDTVLKYDDMPAEVTIYLIGGKSVGGFMRANTQRQAHENLNSKGMVFKKFCISEIRQDQDHKSKEATYSIIGRLSAVAAGREIKDLNKK